MGLVRKRKKKARKICHGQYNNLFAAAEEGLQNSWEDLGLSTEDVIKKSEDNPKLVRDGSVMPPCYFLYKIHANYIVDKILKDLNIEVEE